MNSINTALVVDDDPSTRLLLQKFLARSGYTVDTAKHGGEAVTLLERTEYGVVMLDLMMPILDGHGVLDFLRQNRPRQIERVIIVTAYPRQLSKTDLGVGAVVSKPFTLDALRGVLQSVSNLGPSLSSCAHKNPPEIITETEKWLRDQGISPDRWAGLKVRHGENTPGTMWESVVIEIERRGGDWVVTRLDRNKAPLDEPAGLKLVG